MHKNTRTHTLNGTLHPTRSMKMCFQHTKQKDFETLYVPTSNWHKCIYSFCRVLSLTTEGSRVKWADSASSHFTLYLIHSTFTQTLDSFWKGDHTHQFRGSSCGAIMSCLMSPPTQTLQHTFPTRDFHISQNLHFQISIWHSDVLHIGEIDPDYSSHHHLLGLNMMVSIILLLLRGPSPQSESPFPDPESTTAHSLPPFTLAGHHSYLPPPHTHPFVRALHHAS